MLNAFGLEKRTSFISWKTGTAVRMTTVCESSLYQSKTKKSFLIPIRGLLNLGIVQMGTTKVKALDPKAEVAKVNVYLRNQLMVRSESSNVFLCSFCQR
jgi:hypothetical protein